MGGHGTARSGRFAARLERIEVSADGRSLVTASGAPFFWLGDTAWELFHRCTLEEAALYLADRQRKGFTVIQAVALAEHDGLHTTNRYGQTPLADDDPTRPNEAYFQTIDRIIGLAAKKGLYVGLLPTWGDKVTQAWGRGPAIFDATNAAVYGCWLGERYREQTNLLWVLGGDRPAVTPDADYRPIWRALAEGIRQGTAGRGLMTYHPQGGRSSSEWLHAEPWLDVNMMQSGHGRGRDVPVWEWVARDRGLTPTKPVLDGEPCYEDHPVSPWPRWDPANGYFRDYDVRKQVYRSVLAGACGVTYGHHSIWQFYTADRKPITYPDRTWLEALDRPASRQMGYLRRLLLSRPYLSRVPDQDLLASTPGEGEKHVRAARDADGSYAFIYLPLPLPVTVNLEQLAGQRLIAWWFDPCSGRPALIGEMPRGGQVTVSPAGDRPDWVLVLDDASRGFPAPGSAV
jgi:hypothetical protein